MKLKSAIWAFFLIMGASGIALHAEAVGATAVKVNGNVYATDAAGKSTKLKTGDIIPVGSTIHTNADSSVSLKLVPGATTVVAPGTDLKISTLDYSQSPTGVKTRKIKINLAVGTLYSSLAKHDGSSDFSISTPDGVAAARGTDWSVSFSATSGVTVATVNGVVQLTLPNGKTISVPGGKITTSNGVTTVTGSLTPEQVKEIEDAIAGTNGGGGGTFSITPIDSSSANPANITTSNEMISPNGSGTNDDDPYHHHHYPGGP